MKLKAEYLLLRDVTVENRAGETVGIVARWQGVCRSFPHVENDIKVYFTI